MPRTTSRNILKRLPVQLYVAMGLCVFMVAVLTLITLSAMNADAADPTQPQSARSGVTAATEHLR